jgi:antitoxin MazE
MSRISAWGNSHGVRLPRDVLEAAGIEPDADVTIRAEPGRILITPARRKPTLDELLARMKPGAPAEEIDYGPPRGREVV